MHDDEFYLFKSLDSFISIWILIKRVAACYIDHLNVGVTTGFS